MVISITYKALKFISGYLLTKISIHKTNNWYTL